MKTFNDIGIDSNLDWDRIEHLMKIGIFAGLIALAGDFVLGYGTCNEGLTGFDQYFSRYLTVSDLRVALSAFLGLIGIPLESLCYFSIYRLIVSKSESYAHKYRSGLFGILIFGALVHVVCCITVAYGKLCYASNPVDAPHQIITFALYYLMPASVLFFIFFIYASIIQWKAFSKGYTPYPKKCRIFNLLMGILIIVFMRLFGNQAWAYAVSTGWISLGSLFMFGGLLNHMKEAKHGE